MNIQADLECRICLGIADYFAEYSGRVYYKCRNCSAVLLDSKCYLSQDKEKERYLKHSSDVEDVGYQKFVEPLVALVKNNFTLNHNGLDFGCGHSPVVSKLLKDLGYKVELYDPFFFDDKKALLDKYDFIVCSEVVEHFHFPLKEFKLLKSLLKPNGKLFCMTEFYSDDINFLKWYYKNDSTHVIFYHTKTFSWIKTNLQFSSFVQLGKVAEFML